MGVDALWPFPQLENSKPDFEFQSRSDPSPPGEGAGVAAGPGGTALRKCPRSLMGDLSLPPS